MYSMCNLLGNQLVFLKIETNLYLWFKMVSSRNTVQFLNEIDRIRECQHRKLVFELIFKLLGQYRLKDSAYIFYKCVEWWKMCSTIQYDLLCRNCFDFLLWVKFEFYSQLVLVDCCNFLCCASIFTENDYKKIVVNFLYQRTITQ